MRIFTGYYALIKTYVDADIYPIPISRYIPKSLAYIGLERYFKLAPSESLLMKYREHLINEEGYERLFKTENLDKLNPLEVQDELYDISKGQHIVLLCYESPEKFCHRHLVSAWFRENKIPCGEFS